MKFKQIYADRALAVMQIAPAIAIIATSMILPDRASAAEVTSNDQILKDSCTTLGTIQKWIFGVAYVLGAIGLVVVAISAFLGRFKFAHLIALGGGLFIVAMADGLIKFVTGGKQSANCGGTEFGS
jgi:type IV secretory pathway VirB2 component (pilin)